MYEQPSNLSKLRTQQNPGFLFSSSTRVASSRVNNVQFLYVRTKDLQTDSWVSSIVPNTVVDLMEKNFINLVKMVYIYIPSRTSTA